MKFLKPEHTRESVARQIAEGVADGSIVPGPPAPGEAEAGPEGPPGGYALWFFGSVAAGVCLLVAGYALLSAIFPH